MKRPDSETVADLLAHSGCAIVLAMLVVLIVIASIRVIENLVEPSAEIVIDAALPAQSGCLLREPQQAPTRPKQFPHPPSPFEWEQKS